MGRSVSYQFQVSFPLPLNFSSLPLVLCWSSYTCIYMWQSRVEMEYYSLAYFKHITDFTLNFRYGWGSYMLCQHMNVWCVYKARMSPAPNGSLVPKLSDVLKIHNGRVLAGTAILTPLVIHASWVAVFHPCLKSCMEPWSGSCTCTWSICISVMAFWWKAGVMRSVDKMINNDHVLSQQRRSDFIPSCNQDM